MIFTSSDDELKRYHRQMLMDGWGEEGQKRLKKARVFIAGAGGLGSPVSMYLAAAGVGRIVICDFDVPDLSNLNRQILHDETRLKVNKAASARMTLARVNPNVEVDSVTDRIDESNARELTRGCDLIVDCMDNFPTRFLLNDAAIAHRVPFIHGSISGMEGRLSFIQAPETPCLRCLVPEAPPREVFPVVGATPGVIGSLQALEAVKYLTGVGANLKGKLLIWDGFRMEFHTVTLPRDPDCASCRSVKLAGR